MIKKFLVFQLFTYLLCFIQTTYAQDSDNKVQVKKSIWAAGNYFILNVEIPPSYKEKITLVIHNRNNFSSQLEGIEKGSLKLLDGKILITQGINTPDQFMVDRLDTVSLFTKLAIDLLDIAVPEGLQLKTTKQINIVEKDRTLMVGTLSPSMKLPTPWELTGTVAPLNNNTIDFDFKLHSQDQHISIKGSWEKRTPVPAMDDSMPLTGWKVYTLGVIEFKEGNETIMDYGITAVTLTAKTLGELRKNLSKNQ